DSDANAEVYGTEDKRYQTDEDYPSYEVPKVPAQAYKGQQEHCCEKPQAAVDSPDQSGGFYSHRQPSFTRYRNLSNRRAFGHGCPPRNLTRRLCPIASFAVFCPGNRLANSPPRNYVILDDIRAHRKPEIGALIRPSGSV